MFFKKNKNRFTESLAAITRADVAQRAQTSSQTVSNLFTENEDFPISSETESRITEAMIIILRERVARDEELIHDFEKQKVVSSHS